MSRQTSNKFSPEVRSRAVRLVLDQEAEHRSLWTAIVSIAAKIGCTPQTLLDWVKKAEVDSGKRAGVIDRPRSSPNSGPVVTTVGFIDAVGAIIRCL